MESYIDRKVKFLTQITDAPEIYQKAIALAEISATMLDVPIKFGPVKLFPNLFITVIGPTYDSRKGAIKRLLIEMLPQELYIPAVDFSPEGLQKLKQSGIVNIEEYGSLLTSAVRVPYRAETLRTLRMKYDREPFSKALSAGITETIDFGQTYICYSTSKQFKDALKRGELEDGTVGRGLHTFAERTLFKPKRKLTEAEEKAKVAFRMELKERWEKKPKDIELTKDAETYFNEIQLEREKTRKLKSEAYNAISGRYLDEGILKTSACFARGRLEIDMAGRTLFIEKQDTEKAHELVTSLLEIFTEVFYPELFVSDDVRVMEKLCELYLRNNVPVKYGDLLSYMNMLTSELRPIVETLNDMGKLKVISKGKGEWLVPSDAELQKYMDKLAQKAKVSKLVTPVTPLPFCVKCGTPLTEDKDKRTSELLKELNLGPHCYKCALEVIQEAEKPKVSEELKPVKEETVEAKTSEQPSTPSVESLSYTRSKMRDTVFTFKYTWKEGFTFEEINRVITFCFGLEGERMLPDVLQWMVDNKELEQIEGNKWRFVGG